MQQLAGHFEGWSHCPWKWPCQQLLGSSPLPLQRQLVRKPKHNVWKPCTLNLQTYYLRAYLLTQLQVLDTKSDNLRQEIRFLSSYFHTAYETRKDKLLALFTQVSSCCSSYLCAITPLSSLSYFYKAAHRFWYVSALAIAAQWLWTKLLCYLQTCKNVI